jgi:hypothetical protein
VVSRKPDDEPGSDQGWQDRSQSQARAPVQSPAPARPVRVTHATDTDRGDDEPPVVARLVVEIRSDGSRTIARGALEDVQQGERVAVEARGSSPLSLAMGLMRSILSTPMLARAASRKLLGRSRSR